MFNKKNQRASSLMNSFFPKNHKAQVGETMTWVVATIVIIVVLSFSILLSINIFKDKKFEVEKKTDLLAVKSLTGFLLTEDTNGKKVFDLIKSDEKIKDFEGNLAVDIFENYYHKEGEYDNVWFGINLKGLGLFHRENDYFKERPLTRKGGDISGGFCESVLLEVELSPDKNLELFLVWEKNGK